MAMVVMVLASMLAAVPVVGDIGATAMAEALKGNSVLKMPNLPNNNIGVGGASDVPTSPMQTQTFAPGKLVGGSFCFRKLRVHTRVTIINPLLIIYISHHEHVLYQMLC